MSEIDNLPSRYYVESSLGKGGIGEVFRVHDSLLGMKLALKILSGTARGSKETIIREFKILSELCHPNLVRVYDFGFLSSKAPFFTMELVDGKNLRQFAEDIKNATFIPLIIKEILSALVYLNNKKTLHGDIKPENIMVISNKGGRVSAKLLDFGLAVRITRKQKTISGTIRFLAPEVLSSKSYSPASDLYALGLSLIECITCEEAPIAADITEDFYRRTYSKLNKKLTLAGIKNPSSVTSYILDLAQLNPYGRPKSSSEALQTFLLLSSEQESKPKIHMGDVFVARKNEINRIEDLIKKAHPAEKVLLLEGPRGIGKKSLINQAVQKAQLNGYLVLDLTDDRFTRKSLDRFIETLAKNLVEEQKKKMLDSHIRILASLKSGISPKKDYAPVIFDNIIQFLHELSFKQSVLICIPDIERFGNDFMGFIHHMAYETDFLGSHVLLMISRNTDIPMHKNISQLYGKIESFSFSSILKIDPFSETEIRVLLKEILDDDILSKNETRDLLFRTKGIPLLIVELINHLISVNVIQWEEGRWHLDRRAFTKTYLPESIEEMFRESVKGITRAERFLLQVIAFYREPVTLEELSSLTSIPHAKVDESIINLSRRGLINISGKEINFINPIYAKFTIKHTPVKTKKDINKLIADALEAKEVNEPARISKHFMKSKTIDKAIHYGLIAADQLISKYELFDCLTLLSELKKLAFKIGSESQQMAILNKIAPIELQTGLSNNAAADYKLLIDQTRSYSLKASYSKRLALIYYDFWRQTENAMNHFSKALVYAKKAENIDLEVEILIELGDIISEKGISLLEKAIKLSKNRNISLYAKALSKLLYLYKITGKIRKTERLQNEVTEALNNIEIEVKKEIIFNLYIVYFYSGEYSKATNLIKQKVKIEEDTNDPIGIVSSLSSLGGCHYIQGDFYDQIKILYKALFLTKKYNAYMKSLTILSNLSIAYRRLAEYSESLKILEQADKIMKENNISEVDSIYLLKPTYLYLSFGKATEKEFRNYLEKTRKRAKRFRNSIALGHRHLIYSIYHYHNVNPKRALQFGNKALSLFRNAEDRDDIVDTLAHIGIYLLELKKLKEASKYLMEAREIFDEIHCEYLKPYLLFAEGALARASRKETAGEILTQALRTSKKMGTRETTWQIQREMALYSKETGEMHKAYTYYKDTVETIRQITESIDNEDLKMSYLSVPFRKRVFAEIKSLKHYTL